MAANVETMFYTREKPWHGLGTRVAEAPTSEDALRMAGLDWQVVQEPVCTDDGDVIPGYRANIRDRDRRVLGVVTDRYKIIQNQEAFAFTDALLGKGVRYETAGSLQGGKRVWLLARLPQEYIISGEQISPYLVFSNMHDGSGAVKVALTPVRVVCCNTLNLALDTAKRSWSMIHTGNIRDKLREAEDTLFLAEEYMACLGKEFEDLHRQKLTDLQGVGKNAYRFLNAVSDFATHAKPLRRTANYQENLFMRTMDGNPLIDRAYQMVKAA